MPIITLTTDFGDRDWYVGSMRGVILSICSETRIFDISHDVSNHDVRSAAYILYNAHRWFPEGTVHLAVVDPGVGTPRIPLVVRTSRYFFVAPDNGILSYITTRGDVVAMHRIEEERFLLPRAAQTFHGRDIFAPVAAHLARGERIESFGPPVERIVEFEVPVAAEVEPGRWRGQVMHIDRFGNAITNLSRDLFVGIDPARIVVQFGDYEIDGICGAYGEKEPGEALAVIGGTGNVEIAVNGGSAAYRFGLNPGDIVLLEAKSQ